MPPKRRWNQRGRRANMPGLTGKAGESSPSQRAYEPYYPQPTTPAQGTSSFPLPPPVEPLSPIVGPTSLAPDQASTSKQANAPSGSARQTFTHTQAATQYVAQPSPKPISFEENPDAIALRGALSVLQMQKRKAEGDLVALQRIKDQATEDPKGFRDALLAKRIPKKTDGLFNLSLEDVEGNKDEDDDAEEEDESHNQTSSRRNRNQRRIESNGEEDEDEEMMDTPEPSRDQNEEEDDSTENSDQPGPSSQSNKREKAKKWAALPAKQNVVRMPAINWSQYAVVGESLDKLHEDQRSKPTDGVPQRMGPDGRVKAAEGGKQRSEPAVIAAPYDPNKDKIEKPEKMSTRKGGKR